MKRAEDQGQEDAEPLGRALVLGGQPVVYVARLERVADHGPGRLLTLEAKAERVRGLWGDRVR